MKSRLHRIFPIPQ